MQAPFRLLQTLRGTVEPGLLLATGVATSTFVATPLILPAVAVRFEIGTGMAGLFSAAQLGLFVVGSWGAPRLVEPSRRVFVASLVMLAAASGISIIAPAFSVFVASRALAGLALGVLTWLAYSQVFGDTERTGDIAVIGPLTGVLAAPLIGLALRAGDDRTVFSVLAALALVPLVSIPNFSVSGTASKDRNKAVLQALVLIVALALVTFGGAGVFVFLGAAAVEQYGMDPFVVSLVFSANAAAGIPSARWRGARRYSGAWFVLPALFAAVLGFADQQPLYWVLVTTWGFCFWMAIPGIYNLLAERSRFPADRAGDAQAAMAAGRAFAPLAGGIVVGTGGFEALGLAGAAVMLVGAAVMLAVERSDTGKFDHNGSL